MINGSINPKIIAELTITQSLVEKRKIFWKIKLINNTQNTIISWPIYITMANSTTDKKVFSLALTKALKAFAKPSP